MAKFLAGHDAFIRAARIIEALPNRKSDDTPLRDVLPGLWPTVGDLRKLYAEIMEKRHE